MAAKIWYYTDDGVTRYWRIPKLIDVTFSGITPYTLSTCFDCDLGAPGIKSFVVNSFDANTTVQLTRDDDNASQCPTFYFISTSSAYASSTELSGSCPGGSPVSRNGIHVRLGWDTSFVAWRLIMSNGSSGAGEYFRCAISAAEKYRDGRNLLCQVFNNELTAGTCSPPKGNLAGSGSATLAPGC